MTSPEIAMSETPKELQRILRRVQRHWVGDWFPVRTLFSYPELGPTTRSCFWIMQDSRIPADGETRLREGAPPSRIRDGHDRIQRRGGTSRHVMNRPEQIKQAIEDYQSGRMGHLA